MHEEFVISLKDLRFVSIKCPHCQTVVTLDMERKTEVSSNRDRFFTPNTCPGCAKDFDSALPVNVNALHDAYRSVPEWLRESITFRTEAPSSES